MATLSFVALSMQTTHLDPATVSKASYIKLVDGNITRVDAIPIIPPASPSETKPNHPHEAVDWPAALAQLNMVIGKLPIVSYYRDADKEIFEAASRRSDITPPTFHWLDCRTLARKLLPELPDHQPSTVLQALDLYDEYADGDTVEQTARIVLKLAQQQGADSVRELWGDLYHQPDDLLDLETTLQELANPETDLPDGSEAVPDDEPDAMTAIAGVSSLGTAADSADASSEEPSPFGTANDTAETESVGDPPHGSAPASDDHTPDVEPLAPDTAPISETAVATESSSLGAAPETPAEDTAPATSADPDSKTAEDLTDSTAQSVIEAGHLEQPEFLKVPDHDDSEPDEVFDEPTDEPDTYDVETTAELRPEATAPRDVQSPGARDDTESESADESDTASASLEPADQAQQYSAEPTPRIPLDDRPAAGQATEAPATSAESPAITAEQSAVSHVAPAQSVATPKSPAPIVRPADGSTASPTDPDRVSQSVQNTQHRQQRAATPNHKPATRSGRMWGLTGMLIFGLLTVLGLGLTVMAGRLFFTTNDLLLETTIAGVVLTGAITLLSLLMTAISYRTYRKNS